MSKPRIWIVAVAVGAVAIIAGVKLFGGSADEDETARPQRLAQRETQTEHGGWSVRPNTQDLATSDDVKVQRHADAKPGSLAPPRRNLPLEPQGGQPAAASGSEAKAASPDNGVDGTVPRANAGSDPPKGNEGSIADAGAMNPDAVELNGEVIHAPSGPQAAGGSVAAAPQGGQVVAPAQQGADTQAGGNQQNPTHDQQAPVTPSDVPTPGDLATGTIYDSKDAKFSADTPVEVKDIGPITGQGVTFTMQMTPGWSPDNQDDADLITFGDNLKLIKNVDFLMLQYVDSTGEHSIGTKLSSEKWQNIFANNDSPIQLAVTVNGSQASIIADGKVMADGRFDGAGYQVPSNPGLVIGSDYPANRPVAPTELSKIQVSGPISTAEGLARTGPAPAGAH